MNIHPFRNLGLKSLAVGIAVLLWLTVAGEPVVERILRVPLELQNIPGNMVVVESPPAQVDVRVRGASSALTRMADGDVVAVLEMEEVRPGRRLFAITPDQVRAPFGITVEQVTPGTVWVTVELSSARIVPVEPVIEGVPADGYAIQGVASDPASVEVAGPESSLKTLKHALTEGVSVQGASRTFRQSVTIGVGDPRLRLTEPQTARVTVTIAPASAERVFADVPIRARNASATLRVRVRPETAVVVVRGPSDAVSALAAGALGAFVDLTGLGRGRHIVKVRIDLPKDLEAVRTQPASATVTIQ